MAGGGRAREAEPLNTQRLRAHFGLIRNISFRTSDWANQVQAQGKSQLYFTACTGAHSRRLGLERTRVRFSTNKTGGAAERRSLESSIAAILVAEVLWDARKLWHLVAYRAKNAHEVVLLRLPLLNANVVKAKVQHERASGDGRAWQYAERQFAQDVLGPREECAHAKSLFIVAGSG
jgi:hypothetical protein